MQGIVVFVSFFKYLAKILSGIHRYGIHTFSAQLMAHLAPNADHPTPTMPSNHFPN